MKTENKNFLYNVIYQLLIYIFPLITVPYVSRVLGVENVGIYSYTYSIVYIFMLASLLGINNYGNREVARCRDCILERSKVFFSIYYFQILTTTLAIIIYILYLALVADEYRSIFLIQLIFLLSVVFDINWFYFGLEQFKITITRNIIVKILSVILIFLFVKERADLWKYTLIMASATLLSQLYLFSILHNYLSFVKVSYKETLKHIKGILTLFIPVVAFAIYRVMDKTMIGYFSSVVELGYYENAERIINIPIAVITALGTVMLPRMSYLMKNDESAIVKSISSSMKLALTLACMMACAAFFASDDVSLIMFGPEFVKSGGIIKCLSITIIASAWANVIRTQYLIPKGEDKIYICSTIGGAVVNLISNFIFIPLWGAYGACIGTLLAEIFVAAYQTVKVYRLLPFNNYFQILLKSSLNSILIMLITCFLGNYIENLYARFSVVAVSSILIFFLINKNYLNKEFLH